MRNEYNPTKALLESAKHTEEKKRQKIEEDKKDQRRHNWRVAIVSSVLGALIGSIVTYIISETL